MPRSTAVPKYRKHRASGQAVVTLNGRDFYLGRHGTKASQAEYDRLIGEWTANGRNLPSADARITVVELSVRYLKFAAGYYRKDGRSTDVLHKIKSAVRYLKPGYWRRPATDVGPLALKAIRQKMVEDGLSRSYINEHVARLKRMYKWAAAEELVPESAYRSLALVDGLKCGRTEARETSPVLPVDDTIVDATLPCLPEVVADMVRLQRRTGMRPAEVCLVRPCDLDRTSDVWVFTPESHKTQHHGRDRQIFIGAQGQAILLRYMARAADAYCFRPCDSEEKRLAQRNAARKTPLSCGNTRGSNRVKRPKKTAGDCYTTRSYRQAIYRGCDRAGIDRWAPNRLRHTAATEIRREFGLEAAQVILGHSQAAITQVYAERDAAKGIEVARQIG
ncbi:site-specific tyrosine recombinase XerC [Posidoniimonas corsicana]|uniref:Site-specific tyrosine recombinase XerC n=1 Tax=Posidoniimonas corsicana TaxID=1938618 RepID=A0A5C5VD89_9BACT|nr:site-specific integrase [Posidoniimonas corsicana]TWT35605.1 site-specific tyrosine recombinase XerC [Posidoniimonas corsicana]